MPKPDCWKCVLLNTIKDALIDSMILHTNSIPADMKCPVMVFSRTFFSFGGGVPTLIAVSGVIGGLKLYNSIVGLMLRAVTEELHGLRGRVPRNDEGLREPRAASWR